MTLYTIEADGCFQPRAGVFTREANACSAAAGYTDGLGAPWTDGTFWIDNDGVTLVGWIEADGSLFPPQAVLDAVNA